VNGPSGTGFIPAPVLSQKFVIVNEDGKTLGVFGFGGNGTPMVKLTDENGRIIWSSQPSPILLQSRK
jgi:hypothetical protein